MTTEKNAAPQVPSDGAQSPAGMASPAGAAPTPRMHQCHKCKNLFIQPFVCVACGAERLYDSTLNSAIKRAEKAEAELAEAQAENAWLREALTNAANSLYNSFEPDNQSKVYHAAIDAARMKK